MSTFSLSDKERLTGLLTRKAEIFDKIYALCEKQAELLRDAKIEELETSFKDVQAERKVVEGLQQEAESLMQSYALLPEQERDKKIDELALGIQQQIEKCAKLNEQNMKTIQDMTEEQTKKIDEQSAKRKGITGYAQVVSSAPEMFDSKS